MRQTCGPSASWATWPPHRLFDVGPQVLPRSHQPVVIPLGKRPWPPVNAGNGAQNRRRSGAVSRGVRRTLVLVALVLVLLVPAGCGGGDDGGGGGGGTTTKTDDYGY